MSDYYSVAMVKTRLDNSDPIKAMDDLKKQLEEAIRKRDNFTSPREWKKHSKEIADIRKQMALVATATNEAGTFMKKLDKMDLRTLQSTLKSLKGHFKTLTPNSKAFNETARKIQAITARIKEMNSAMASQKSPVNSAGGAIKKLGGAIASAVATIGVFINKAKEFVEAFAKIDAEMANVRKYTKMSVAEVNELNEAFKKMDTRTSREELNRLAQDAGRLGKTSVEDVLGFVRAADTLKVALEDLGDSAPLTLSKLTGVFGVEQQLGTEKSLLAVGSVINELSQNCAASAPYLAEFASRMGGVASQAGMTAQQVFAYGSVLDAANQKVEASSTALAQVITRLYTDPAKYAKVAGLEADKFAQLVRTDMNGALMLLLETLGKSGGMQVLAPMFKDMGENGSRAIATLSTLAGQIDMVKRQQQEADKAFREATSVGREFAVQNSTVAAEIDKMKKEAAEMAAQLGEQLYPAMKYVYQSSSVALSVLKTMFQFLKDNKGTILAITAGIAAYNIALHWATIRTKAHIIATKAAASASKGWHNVVTVSANLMKLFAARIAMVTTNQERQRIASLKFEEAQKALKASTAGLVGGLVALGVALVALGVKLYNTFSIQKSLNEAQKKANELCAEEVSKINILTKAVHNNALSLVDRQKAIDELQRIIPDYHAKLTAEGKLYDDNTDSINNYIEAIKKAAKIEAAKETITRLYKDYFDAQADLMDAGGVKESIAEHGLGGTVSRNLIPGRALKMWWNTGAKYWNKAKAKSSLEKAEALAEWAGANVEDFIPTENRGGESVEPNREFAKRNKDYADALAAIEARYSKNYITPQPATPSPYILKPQPTGFTDWKTATPVAETATSTPDAQQQRQWEIMQLNKRFASQMQTAPKTEAEDSPYVSTSQAEKEAKKSEREARIAARKEKAGFKAKEDALKAERDDSLAINEAEMAMGVKTYSDYIAEKQRIDKRYADDRVALFETLYADETDENKKNLTAYDKDYREALLNRAKLQNEQAAQNSKQSVAELKALYAKDVARSDADFYTPGSATYGNEEAHQEELNRLKLDYLKRYAEAYAEGSKERLDYETQLTEEETRQKNEKLKKLAKAFEQWQSQNTAVELGKRLAKELADTRALYDAKLITLEEYTEKVNRLNAEAKTEAGGSMAKSSGNLSAEKMGKIQKEREDAEKAVKKAQADGIITEAEARQEMANIAVNANHAMLEDARNCMDEQTRMVVDFSMAWVDVFTKISEGGKLSFEDLQDIASTSLQAVCAALQTVSQFAQAEAQIQINAVNKRYDAEIAAAEGNSYRVRKLEEEKERKTAKIKQEAQKKEFTLKVFQAIAQTAMNALMAYGSLAQIPVVGPALGASAAALATALGMVQVALIKKQQQAAESSGYSQGGFTPKGRVDEPVGVVHAGEWVASQKLLANPTARAMINTLDYAQRNNAVATLSRDDVAATITAPVRANLAASQIREEVVAIPATTAQDSNALTETIEALNKRLKQPFITVNSVTGEVGMKKAEEEYKRLMNNKNPKK